MAIVVLSPGDICQTPTYEYLSLSPNADLSKRPSLHSLITLLKRWWTFPTSLGDIFAEQVPGETAGAELSRVALSD